MRKLAPARVSYRDDFFFISYRVYMLTGLFHISLFKGTLHVDKIHVRFKHYGRATHSSLPVDRFHPETSGRFAFNDTVARFRTGVKFSPRYKNWGELTPG